MSDRRNRRRYPISEDRAHITIVVNQAQYRAVLADMSATGFGVLAMRGVPLEPKQMIVVVTDVAIFECAVAYSIPDDSFQKGRSAVSARPHPDLTAGSEGSAEVLQGLAIDR